MQTTDEIPLTYDEAVRLLARWHGEGGPSDLVVYSIPDPAAESVQLIEVSDDFPTSGAVRPLFFGRSELFPFRSGAALLTPEEWQELVAGRLTLPPGWDLASKRQVWP
jgi:hypothetical protein